MKYIVYTDGGARGNPGIAGCGVYITDHNGKAIEKRHKYIGHATNNIAEYSAAFLGINRAIELGAKYIELRSDSQLLIEQLSGRYKVKNPGLKDFVTRINTVLLNWGGEILFTHIYREQNTEADRLSNVAMDEGIKSLL